MVAVPTTIFQLILRQPVDRSSNPRVIRVAELDQSPNHISRETRLVPSLSLLDLARAGEGTGLCLVKVEKSLAFRTDPMIGRSLHFSEKCKGPDSGRPFWTITALLGRPDTLARLCSDDLFDRSVARNLLTRRQDTFSILCLVQQINESLIPYRRVLGIK